MLTCINCSYEYDELEEDKLCQTCWKAWDKSRIEERARIIQYLIDNEVLRKSMFGNSWVALHHSEGYGIDLGRNFGGK